MTASADAFAGCKFRRPNGFTITFRIVDYSFLARRAGAVSLLLSLPSKKVDNNTAGNLRR